LTPVGKLKFSEDKEVYHSQESNPFFAKTAYLTQKQQLFTQKQISSPPLDKRELYKDNDSSPNSTKKSSPQKEEEKSQIDEKSEKSDQDTQLLGKRKRCPLIEGCNRSVRGGFPG